MKSYLLLGLAVAMAAGCGKKDESKTAAPAPSVMSPAPQQNPAPPPPAAPNAVDDGIQRPAPGQANDHSSPGFKDGGKTDPKK